MDLLFLGMEDGAFLGYDPVSTAGAGEPDTLVWRPPGLALQPLPPHVPHDAAQQNWPFAVVTPHAQSASAGFPSGQVGCGSGSGAATHLT